ncbi:MAG: MFS transporter, partial [Rivularia sp. (in: cyanobacteria)]
MSARDVSKNDSKNNQNHHQSVSEIPRIDVDKNWENKIKDELYSHDSNSSNLEKNSPATAKFLQKSDLSKESNGKNKVVINTNAQGFLPILTNPNFLALWGGQVFCQLADKVYLVLMIALINTQFQSEGSSISGWVSALMMTFTIPAVLFGSLAGVFVDRWTKKTVLVSTN